MSEKVKIRTITDPREKLEAELEEVEAGNQRTRDEIARLHDLLKGGLEAASKIKDQLQQKSSALTELEITKADREAFAKLPEGWFESFEVSWRVRCADFRLGRLVDRGMVEQRVEGTYPDSTRLYRKIGASNADAVATGKGNEG